MSKEKEPVPVAMQDEDFPPEDDNVDIDYTDFTFDEPQEFCVSMLDEAIERQPSQADSDEPKALPLSAFGLTHWSEALSIPMFDPNVDVVDVRKVSCVFSLFYNQKKKVSQCHRANSLIGMCDFGKFLTVGKGSNLC